MLGELCGGRVDSTEQGCERRGRKNVQLGTAMKSSPVVIFYSPFSAIWINNLSQFAWTEGFPETWEFHC